MISSFLYLVCSLLLLLLLILIIYKNDQATYSELDKYMYNEI